MSRIIPRIGVFLKIIIFSGCVYFVATRVDTGDILRSIAGISPLIFFGCVFLIFIQAVLAGVRWFLVLKSLNCDVNKNDVIIVSFIGLFCSQVFPGSVGGDVVKAWLSRRLGLRMQTAIGSIIIERLVNLLVVLFMGVCAFLVLFRNVEMGFPSPDHISFVVVFASCLFFVFIIILYFVRFDVNPNFERSIALAKEFSVIFKRQGLFITVICIGFVGQMLLAFVVFLLAQSLNIELSYIESLAVMPIVVLFTALPVSVGGWGTREIAFVGTLNLLGINASNAIAISVALGFIGLLSSLPGVIFMLLKKFGFH